jgi:F0F1-type ATP synthase alpha subunit
MKLRPEEITSILRERIENFDTESNLAEVGAVPDRDDFDVVDAHLGETVAVP